MYSKLALLSKSRLLYPNPADVLKARCSIQTSWCTKNSLFYPNLVCSIQTKSWCTQSSLFYLNTYILWKTPDFLSKPLMYSKLALLSKTRLLYPNPADVLKARYSIQTSWCTQKLTVLSKSRLFYPNQELMYSKFAVLSKHIYFMKNLRFFIQVSMIYSKLALLSELRLFYPNPADVLKARCFI